MFRWPYYSAHIGKLSRQWTILYKTHWQGLTFNKSSLYHCSHSSESLTLVTGYCSHSINLQPSLTNHFQLHNPPICTCYSNSTNQFSLCWLYLQQHGRCAFIYSASLVCNDYLLLSIRPVQSFNLMQSHPATYPLTQCQHVLSLWHMAAAHVSGSGLCAWILCAL